MKTIYTYIITTLLLLTAGTTYSQQTPQVNGSIIIENLQIEEKENQLHLTFNVVVSGQAMNQRQSWSIIPQLNATDNTHTTTFPYILINGRQKQRHYNRKIQYQNIELTTNLPIAHTHITKQTDTTLTYTTHIPYQEWMQNSSLQINQILTSSREKKQLFVIRDLKTLSPTTPEPEPEPEPQTNNIQPPKPPRERHIHAAAYLDFPRGKTDLRPAYRNNPTELAKIAKDITQITTTPGAQIQTIQITGYASPEGSHTHNEHLAAARAAAFKTYIAETYNLPIEKIKVTSIAEDWNGLRLLVEQSDLIRKAEVLTIIDSPATPDQKEQQLRTLGWPWTAISTTMFPLLRRVEYTIHYTVTEDP